MTTRDVTLMLLAGFLTVTGIIYVTAASETRVFTPIPITQLPTYRGPHAEISGRVVISRREGDGDWHVRLTAFDGESFAVGEIIPELPRAHPRVNMCIAMRGITRFNKMHGWWELHPLIQWREITCPPVPE
jgi:hypothetical protein